MQTVLGFGGSIGIELAKAQRAYTNNIRLVSREPRYDQPEYELVACDLTQSADVHDALKYTKIAYLTAGLPYNTSIWTSQWPLIVQHVLDACMAHGCKLVFFDNVYMYDCDRLSLMTEDTPVKPCSKKGKVRAHIAQMVLDAIRSKKMEAMIVRSADFYGPSTDGNSLLTEMVFKRLAIGKPARWFCSLDYKHAFTFTPDAGKATALLGNTADAYGQIWHLPTAPDPPTGKEWIDSIASAMEQPPRHQVVSRFMVRLLGLFVPTLKEMSEMLYQYDRDYHLSSAKFESRFHMRPTPYEAGIQQIIASDFKTN